ncbi:hypothetical protein GCM10023165_34250 [Variovorax defluvii]|uniref:Flagellar hook-length control protein FliK n=1 Tax=Variovorax defluvii TaxID=913761 RepID=A0ABP8HZW4_9BURK
MSDRIDNTAPPARVKTQMPSMAPKQSSDLDLLADRFEALLQEAASPPFDPHPLAASPLVQDPGEAPSPLGRPSLGASQVPKGAAQEAPRDVPLEAQHESPHDAPTVAPQGAGAPEAPDEGPQEPPQEAPGDAPPELVAEESCQIAGSPSIDPRIPTALRRLQLKQQQLQRQREVKLQEDAARSAGLAGAVSAQSDRSTASGATAPGDLRAVGRVEEIARAPEAPQELSAAPPELLDLPTLQANDARAEEVAVEQNARDPSSETSPIRHEHVRQQSQRQEIAAGEAAAAQVVQAQLVQQLNTPESLPLQLLESI